MDNGDKHFENNEYKNALQSYQEYVKLIDMNDSELLAEVYLKISTTYGCLENDEEKKSYANQAILIFERLGLKDRISYARCFFNIAEAYYYRDNFDASRNYSTLYQTHLINLNLENSFEMGNYFIMSSKIYFKKKEFENCIRDSLKGAEIFANNDNYLNNLACCYRYAGDASGHIKRFNCFKSYFQKAVDLYERCQNEKEIAFCYKKLSSACGCLEEHESCLDFALRSYNIYNRLNIERTYLFASSIKHVGIAHGKNKNNQEAYGWFQRSLEMFTALQDQNEIDDLNKKINR